jgi:hypothetical protein
MQTINKSKQQLLKEGKIGVINQMEVWKDVIGYEGLYKVSSIGAVKSMDRISTYMTGRKRRLKGRILNIVTNQFGYVYYGLIKDGVVRNKFAHRLVLDAFSTNPENKEQVNHINGIKTDNRVENLEWATAFENQQHRFNTLGHISSMRKLNKNAVFDILSNRKKNSNHTEKYNISRGTVTNVRLGIIYKKWFSEFNAKQILKN